jgi:hypothetical protein
MGMGCSVLIVSDYPENATLTDRFPDLKKHDKSDEGVL